jgi:hypothetical protein
LSLTIQTGERQKLVAAIALEKNQRCVLEIVQVLMEAVVTIVFHVNLCPSGMSY